MEKEISLFDKAYDFYQKKEFKKAFTLFLQAAKNGDVNAMEWVAVMYGDGEGVACNISKSIYWDMKAIEVGSIVSVSNLAITYRNNGDIEKAKAYFKKAIEFGDYDAALELAKIYMVNGKEQATAKELLNLVIHNSTLATETSVEEAKKLLLEIDTI